MWTPDAVNGIITNAMWGVVVILIIYCCFLRKG